MKFWHFKLAFKQFKNRLKYPITYTHSSSWDNDDHSHICIAAMLLDKDDFKSVCPCQGKCELIGWDEICEYCQYSAIIDYQTSENGNKYIDIIGTKRLKNFENES